MYAQKCQFSDTVEDEMAKSSAEINTSNGGETSALDQKPVKAPVKIRQSLAPRSSIAKSIVRTKNVRFTRIIIISENLNFQITSIHDQWGNQEKFSGRRG